MQTTQKTTLPDFVFPLANQLRKKYAQERAEAQAKQEREEAEEAAAWAAFEDKLREMIPDHLREYLVMDTENRRRPFHAPLQIGIPGLEPIVIGYQEKGDRYEISSVYAGCYSIDPDPEFKVNWRGCDDPAYTLERKAHHCGDLDEAIGLTAIQVEHKTKLEVRIEQLNAALKCELTSSAASNDLPKGSFAAFVKTAQIARQLANRGDWLRRGENLRRELQEMANLDLKEAKIELHPYFGVTLSIESYLFTVYNRDYFMDTPSLIDQCAACGTLTKSVRISNVNNLANYTEQFKPWPFHTCPDASTADRLTTLIKDLIQENLPEQP